MTRYKKKFFHLFGLTTLTFFLLVIINLSFIGFSKIKTEPYKTILFPSFIEISKNYILMKLGISGDPNKVIVGKTGWLYLGNKYNDVSINNRGLQRYSNSDIISWAKNINHIQQQLKAYGIPSFIVIAPNKHTIYENNLPTGYNTDNKSFTDNLVEAAKSYDINLINLKAVLKNQKTSIQETYYKGDSHWNPIGASIGYSTTMEIINNVLGSNYHFINNALFNPFPVSSTGRVGTARLLKIENILENDYDLNYSLNFLGIKDSICTSTWSLLGVLQSKRCIPQVNNKELLENNKIQLIENNFALNQTDVLWLRDSFGGANSQLYVKTFSKLWMAHYYWLSGENLKKFIIKHKPKLVIYQIVERALFTSEVQKKFDLNTKQK